MLVIIGLIVGGVLVGRDLISAAAIRAQISQIEKYNSAANTFKGKYGYLPGDIKDPEATSFGFTARGTYPGQGDGNSIIQGVGNLATQSNSGVYETGGETLAFWTDLATARLIAGSFTSAAATNVTASVGFNQYFPEAAMGQGNFVYVWSGGTVNSYLGQGDAINYFGISAVTGINIACCGVRSKPAMTVAQASAIDTKIDDGFPQYGRVTAIYLNTDLQPAYPSWAAGGGAEGMNVSHSLGLTATPASSTTCYDNGGAYGKPYYSLGQNGGANMNCALSFRFQ